MDAVNESSTTADDGLSVTSGSSALSETLDLFVALVGEPGDDNTAARLILHRSEERMSSKTETKGDSFFSSDAYARLTRDHADLAEAYAKLKQEKEALEVENGTKDKLIERLNASVKNPPAAEGSAGGTPIREQRSAETDSPASSAPSDSATIGVATVPSKEETEVLDKVKKLLNGALGVIDNGEIGSDTVKVLLDAAKEGMDTLNSSFVDQVNVSMATTDAQVVLDKVHDSTAILFAKAVIKAVVAVGVPGTVEMATEALTDAGLLAQPFDVVKKHHHAYHGGAETLES